MAIAAAPAAAAGVESRLCSRSSVEGSLPLSGRAGWSLSSVGGGGGVVGGAVLEEQCGQNMAGDQQPVTEGEPHGADARAHVQVSV